MVDVSSYVEKAKESMYFSGARIDRDLSDVLSAQASAIRAVGEESRGSVSRIFLVGSGGSYANLLSMKYIFDGVVPTPTEVVPSYELLWREHLALNEEAIVFFASLSGETEDTVAALRHARSKGARTVAIVRSTDTTLGREAETVIPYDSVACYEAPMALLTLFADAFVASSETASLVESLMALPSILAEVMAGEAPRAEALAKEYLGSQHMFVLGSGPLSALAYKAAMSVLMENVRIAGSYSDACEFRHGPAEALERIRPDMMFLVGTDASREMTLRTLDFCRSHGARAIVYDADAFGPVVHPLLTPLVMNSIIQWFVVYSAIYRGILDLDERVFMGRNVLAVGGAGWP